MLPWGPPDPSGPRARSPCLTLSTLTSGSATGAVRTVAVTSLGRSLRGSSGRAAVVPQGCTECEGEPTPAGWGRGDACPQSTSLTWQRPLRPSSSPAHSCSRRCSLLRVSCAGRGGFSAGSSVCSHRSSWPWPLPVLPHLLPWAPFSCSGPLPQQRSGSACRWAPVHGSAACSPRPPGGAWEPPRVRSWGPS